MKNILILAFIFSSSLLSLFANNEDNTVRKEVDITGQVIDKETNEPLEYATIAFIDKSLNKIVTGGITDSNGFFNINVKKGQYDITIEYISFKKQTLRNKLLTEDENLGIIKLELDVEALDAVEVIAERTTVEIKLDKKIYNVGKDLTVRGGTVSDVLDNVPSVSVDVEGNVSLRGQDNVRILINGKPSGLVGLNSTDALRQLPAEAIEKVEVITSPSARYDAEGTAGILNIILRRSKLQGLNGAITLNASEPTGYGVSGNINYRTGNVNIFSTSGYRYSDSPGNSKTETEYFNSGTFFNEYRDINRTRKGYNTNSGIEWYINNTTSLTAAFLIRESDNERETTNTINELDNSGNLLNQSIRFDPEFEDDKTTQFSLNFDKQFNGNSDHRLTADFQYENSNEDEESIITQDGADSERVQTLESQKRILLQTDFVKPIGEKGQFELGYRGNFNQLDTDYILEFNENGNFELDTNLSNLLLYKEHNNAFYTQFGSKIKDKFSFLLGLRYESSRISINQVTSGDYENQNYSGFFPTLNLGYEISEDQSLTIGYNRRIRRPRSRFINPFPSRSSATNLFQGNPNIKPSYSNSADLGYLNRFGKLTLNSSIYFTHATDVFTFISEDSGQIAIVGGTEVPVIVRRPINLATNDRFGFEFTLTYRPSRKWNLNGNFNLFQSVTRGDYNGDNYDAENLSWFIRLNNKYTLPGEIDWQTRIFYMGPREDAINKIKGMFSTSLAFSKDLFNEKASIALNVSDLFNTRKREMISTTSTFYSDSQYQWRQRTVSMSFTYRFNQKKKRQQGARENGGGDDEMGF